MNRKKHVCVITRVCGIKTTETEHSKSPIKAQKCWTVLGCILMYWKKMFELVYLHACIIHTIFWLSYSCFLVDHIWLPKQIDGFIKDLTDLQYVTGLDHAYIPCLTGIYVTIKFCSDCVYIYKLEGYQIVTMEISQNLHRHSYWKYNQNSYEAISSVKVISSFNTNILQTLWY